MGDKPAVKLVVVDDERTILLTLEAAAHTPRLRAAHSRTTASAGTALVRKIKPDLVLLDLGLPDADGLDVLRELKSEFPADAGDHPHGQRFAEQRDRIDQAGRLPFHQQTLRGRGIDQPDSARDRAARNSSGKRRLCARKSKQLSQRLEKAETSARAGHQKPLDARREGTRRARRADRCERAARSARAAWARR